MKEMEKYTDKVTEKIPDFEDDELLNLLTKTKAKFSHLKQEFNVRLESLKCRLRDLGVRF